MAVPVPVPPERVERLAYSPTEAAKAIGISRAKFYMLLADGVIPSIKLGSRRLIRVADLESLLEGGEVA